MKDEKETKRLLMDSAREEFLEKGYMNASLRNICKRAGVTTGALYFFFKDKDDLFLSLIKEPLGIVKELIEQHFAQERNLHNKQEMLKYQQEIHDVEIAMQIIHVLYTYRTDFILLLTKGQGSSVETVPDEFAEMVEKHNSMMARKMQDDSTSKQILHWISHIQVDVFTYMIINIENEKEALQYIKHAIDFMICGWNGMFGISEVRS